MRQSPLTHGCTQQERAETAAVAEPGLPATGDFPVGFPQREGLCLAQPSSASYMNRLSVPLASHRLFFKYHPSSLPAHETGLGWDRVVIVCHGVCTYSLLNLIHRSSRCDEIGCGCERDAQPPSRSLALPVIGGWHRIVPDVNHILLANRNRNRATECGAG
jgi:hypothetical protein